MSENSLTKTSTYLLDSNVVIALTFTGHLHHERALRWFLAECQAFATCPITQGSLVRYGLRQVPGDPEWSKGLLRKITSHKHHTFWPDSLSFDDLEMRGVVGHSQVTDAYLVGLAEHHGGKLATFDEALTTVFPQACLIPD